MAVDISITGVPELQRALRMLADKTQKRIVSHALTKESKRTKQRVVENIVRLGLIDSGNLLSAFESAAIRSANKKSLIVKGIAIPTRAQLGISPNDPYFYPYAVEYGHKGAIPHPYIRPAIDNHKQQSIADIAQDIGSGIERAAKKL